MTGVELLQDLESSGFRFRLRGDRFEVCPVNRLGSEIRETLCQHRDEILSELRRRAAPDLVDGAEVLEEQCRPVAWRLWSRTLGRDLWLCRDRRTRDEIAAEHSGVPAILLAEVPLLRGKPLELVRAIVEAKSVFADAELQA